jgi:hypothetical protein
MLMNIWQVLEIESTTDQNQIKQAYVKKIKKCKPEIDPEGFKLLRQSYEIALKHAAGLSINIELENDISVQQQTQSTIHKIESDPEQAVFQLLNTLSNDQQSAVDMIDDFKKKGFFDNLEYSEEFQKILAMHLLKASYRSLFFITYVIDLFDWFSRVDREKADSFFINALINLINQTRTFRFLQYLYFLKKIKNEKEAKQHNIKLDNCFAANILLSSTTMINFLIIRFFKPKKANAIFSLCNEIYEKYPEALYLGINLSSFLNANKLLYKKESSRNILNYMWLTVFVIAIFIKVIDWGKKADVSAPIVTSTKGLQIDSKPVAILNDNMNKIIENNVADTIKPTYKVVLNKNVIISNKADVFTLNSSLSKMAISSGIVFLADGSFINGDVINRIEKSNNISIKKIIYNNFNKYLHEIYSASEMKKIKSNILITIVVDGYGLRKISYNGSENLVPVLNVTVETKQNESVRKDKYYVVGDEKMLLSGDSWKSLQASPKQLEELWNKAASIAANTWVYQYSNLT